MTGSDDEAHAAIAVRKFRSKEGGAVNILGVDPGIHGGLAVVFVAANGAAPQLVDAIDIPVIGVGAKERVNVLAIREWLAPHAPQHAFIERSQAMPQQGSSSGFKYGRAVGAIETVITCCAIPLTIVEPSIWKKFHRLRGGDKEQARQRAMQLFPAAHALLARKRDHGRAEAALLALFGNTGGHHGVDKGAAAEDVSD
jgi:crossover junction endodeoxyribonuclease RuvC